MSLSASTLSNMNKEMLLNVPVRRRLLLLLQALWVSLINVAFSALAVVHLTYLGSVFTSSVDYMEEDEVRDGSTGSDVQTRSLSSSSLSLSLSPCRMMSPTTPSRSGPS